MGTHSVYTHTFSLDRKEHCPVCGGEAVEVTRPASSTLLEMVDWLLASPSLSVFPTNPPLHPIHTDRDRMAAKSRNRR